MGREWRERRRISRKSKQQLVILLWQKEHIEARDWIDGVCGMDEAG